MALYFSTLFAFCGNLNGFWLAASFLGDAYHFNACNRRSWALAFQFSISWTIWSLIYPSYYHRRSRCLVGPRIIGFFADVIGCGSVGLAFLLDLLAFVHHPIPLPLLLKPRLQP